MKQWELIVNEKIKHIEIWTKWQIFCRCSNTFSSVIIIVFSLKFHFSCFNSFAPGKFEWNFRYLIFKRILVIDGWCISCEIGLIWMSLDWTDDQSTLVQLMAWCRQATSHYLSQCWPRSLLLYGVTRPQWVDRLVLWPSDIIWHHITWSTLFQAMVCCLTAPSHFLSQSWLIINEILWFSPEGNFTGKAQDIYPWYEFENY